GLHPAWSGLGGRLSALAACGGLHAGPNGDGSEGDDGPESGARSRLTDNDHGGHARGRGEFAQSTAVNADPRRLDEIAPLLDLRPARYFVLDNGDASALRRGTVDIPAGRAQQLHGRGHTPEISRLMTQA